MTYPVLAHNRTAQQAAAHLRLIAVVWRDLADSVATPNTSTWPPAGLRHHLAAREEADGPDAEAYAYAAAGPDARARTAALRLLAREEPPPGWTGAVLDLGVVYAMQAVTEALATLADQIAQAVQRSPMTPAPPRRSRPDTARARRLLEEDDARRNELAFKDSRDPRRWSYTDDRRRTAPLAALWLLGRLQGSRGPFRPLTAAHIKHITSVSRRCADLVERAVGTGARTTQLAHPCPLCGGDLAMHGGTGASPAVRCEQCGRTWTGHDTRPTGNTTIKPWV